MYLLFQSSIGNNRARTNLINSGTDHCPAANPKTGFRKKGDANCSCEIPFASTSASAMPALFQREAFHSVSAPASTAIDTAGSPSFVTTPAAILFDSISNASH